MRTYEAFYELDSPSKLITQRCSILPFLAFFSYLPRGLEHIIWLSPLDKKSPNLILQCVVKEPLLETNTLAWMWLRLYGTDNTYFPKSHFYLSIHVIVATTQTEKAQLGCFNILNKFRSAYKKKNKRRKSKPSAKKVTNYFASLNYASVQLVQRAEWDLLGAQSLTTNFYQHSAVKVSSPHDCRPPESLIRWCFRNNWTTYSSQLRLCWILSCTWADISSGFRSPLFSSILYRGVKAHFVVCTHIWSPSPAFFKFRTNDISMHELFLLAFRLWCSKASFWKKQKTKKLPPNNGAIYL